MHWRIPLFAACLVGTDSASGADPSRLVPEHSPRNDELLQHDAIRETLVFYDSDYDAHWVEDPAEIAKWFVRRGVQAKNVPELVTWLNEKITRDEAIGTSIVFAMGVAPTAIVYPPFDDSLLARYVKAGGRVVWLANVPMYVAQGESGSKFMYGETPRQTMLGLSSDPKNFYGMEGPTLTSSGSDWGLELGNGLSRPVRRAGVSVCFFQDPTNEWCGVGLVNWRPDVPWSGFIFVPDPMKPTREDLLRNAYRLATYSGAPVIIPSPTLLFEETAPIEASLLFGEDNLRTTFLRDEIVSLRLRVKSLVSEPIVASVRGRIFDGATLLRQWTHPLTITTQESDVVLGDVDLRHLRRGVYPISVTITPGVMPDDFFHGADLTWTRELRVAPSPDHEGTHVALWVDASPAPKRAEHLLDWLDEHDLQPLFVDDHATARDLALWHGQSFSVRRLGNSANAPAPPGYDSWRRGANGEIMPLLAQGNKRIAMGYANPYRRQLEADDFGQQIAFDDVFPAFRRRALTSDDYSQFFGADYNTFVTEGFFARYGIAAPRPQELGDSADLGKVPPPPPGIVSDPDPWLLLNRYWCEDVHGDTASRLSDAMAENTEGMGKVGQISGGMQIPVMYAPTGQYPPYSMGPKGYSLLSFYYYNRLWQPPLAHIWWLEVARMGNRGYEQWIMPDSGFEGDQTSALYDHFGWLMLAGGATGIEYFNDDSKRPGGIEAMTHFGKLSREYGRLLGMLKPARKKVALLVPFEQLVYKPSSAFEWVYPFMDLLQAKIDVEPVSPDELVADASDHYDAILLAQTTWLKASTAAWLVNYAQRGGKLVLDAPSAAALQLPGAMNLSMRIGGTSLETTSLPEQIAATKAALQGIVESPVDCDDPNVTLRRFEALGTPYLYVNHNLTNAEYLLYRQSNFQHETIAERLGYGSDEVEVQMERPDDHRIPFDILAHRVLPAERHHGRMMFSLLIPKWQGRIVAFLPALPRRMVWFGPSNTTPGARTFLQIRVLDRHHDVVNTLFPLHVVVTDPHGEISKEYSGRLLARQGIATLPIEFASNDVEGSWTLTVRDAMTGLRAHTNLELKKTSRKPQRNAGRAAIPR
jgi:hypothetical protein